MCKFCVFVSKIKLRKKKKEVCISLKNICEKKFKPKNNALYKTSLNNQIIIVKIIVNLEILSALEVLKSVIFE